jgi:hypothetical protein
MHDTCEGRPVVKTTGMIASIVAFLALTLSSNLSAQNVATKVTNAQLISAGTTALSNPTTGIIPVDDLRIKPSKDTEIGEGVSFSFESRFPQASPSDLGGMPSSFFGFPGLTHRDQRLAGTGAYANTQFSVEPPDQGLAAGNGFILEAINDALAVYDQHTGNLLVGPTPLNQFYNLAPEIIRPTGPYGDFLSDPRCYFDRQLHRWFVTILQIDVDPTTGNFGSRSHLLIAVSQTADPTQGFNLFSLDVTDDGLNGTQDHTADGCPCYGDQPLIGADAHGFYLSTNEFSINGGPLIINRAQIYAMSKKKLAQGTLPTVVHLSGLSVPGGGRAFSIQPAASPNLEEDEDDSGIEYFVSSFSTRLATNNQLTVWALSNTRSLKKSNPDVSITNVVIPSEIYSVPPDAVQKTGPIPLGDLVGEPEEFVATNEHRMQQVTFADGKLFSGVTTGIQQGANLVAGIAYFVVAPSFRDGSVSARVKTQGYISLLNNNVFYPSVGVTEDGKGVIAFSISGPDFFPSVAFTSFDEERGAGSIRIAAAGVAPDDGFSGYKAFGGAGSGRWGDYSAAVADGDTVWFASEYIPGPRTTLANWGTFIASKHVD